MGNVLKNSQGNVLISNNNAFEISSSIDSNITPGNIKKDVNILGVTGTYEGAGGGFRCTNKLMDLGGRFSLEERTFQYTFDGQLADCALLLCSSNLNYTDGGLFQLKNTSDTSFRWDNKTVTPGEIIFKDKFNSYYDYHIGNNTELVASKSLHFIETDLDITLTISSTGLLSISNPNNGDTIQGNLCMGVVFKGIDGTYDYDIFPVSYYIYD